MASSCALGEHFERPVESLVKSGRYGSANDVMRDGLRLVEERERQHGAMLEALRKDIRESLDGGPAEPLDMAAVKAEAHARRTAER